MFTVTQLSNMLQKLIKNGTISAEHPCTHVSIVIDDGKAERLKLVMLKNGSILLKR